MTERKKKEKEKESYTKYELARIIGARALQISASAPILLKLSKEQLEALNYDPIEIAKLEFEAGVLPITVKRPMPKKIEKPLVEKPAIEIIEAERELPPAEEAVIEEKALIEEEAEREAEEAEQIEESIAEAEAGAEEF